MSIDVNGYCVESVCGESLAYELVERVCQGNLPQYLVQRDNWRTLSAQFELHGHRLVIKIPRARNARLWERILSLFRGSDVARLYHGMHTLSQLGIIGMRPILIATKSTMGMTVDSFLIYEYLEGRPCTDADAKPIAEAILELHNLGYMRRDIHLGNFLITPNGQLGMIDFRISHPQIFRQLRLDLELVQMLSSIPSTRKHVPDKRLNSHFFKAATSWYVVQTQVRKIRKKIKGLVIS